jgi:BTB/POZ domain
MEVSSTALVVYDSDHELPAEALSDRLLWRLDPEASRSDWTIQVIVVKNKSNDDSIDTGINGNNNANNKNDLLAPVVRTYHVHKHILTVGPRHCEYFVHLLSGGGRFSESQTSTSRIELHALAANEFPIFLDYIYSTEKDDPISLTTANATALYSLAKYFQMPRLQRLAKKFWKADIKRSKACEMYYEHATLLQEATILQAATRSCKNNIMTITTSSRLLCSTFIQFWLDLESDRSLPKTHAYCLHLSQLVARLFQNNIVEPQVSSS